MDGNFLSREEFLAKALELRPLISETTNRIPNKFNTCYYNGFGSTFVDNLEFDKRLNKWISFRIEMNFVEIFNNDINSYGINDTTWVHPYGFNVEGMSIRKMKSDPKIHIPRKEKTNA